MTMKRLVPKTCLLVVVDVQEKLAPAMPVGAMGRVIKNTVLLLDAAWRLGVRTIASEQYPKGLGGTMPELASALGAIKVTPMAKTHFDALSDDAIHKAAFAVRPDAVIIVGMEAHVCVFQTARSFVDRGVTTYVVSDAVASRTEENRLSGLHLAERAGAVVTNAETVVFDWLEQAGSDEFKALSKLIR
jgi:nicotinamidase-related amidase